LYPRVKRLFSYFNVAQISYFDVATERLMGKFLSDVRALASLFFIRKKKARALPYHLSKRLNKVHNKL